MGVRREQFAVSADMSRHLRQEIERLPEESWQIWKMEKGGVIKEWAEVPYVPSRQYERRDSQPYRYLAVRLRRQQGELFHDGIQVRHFCVVTNIWEKDGPELLEWQRGKAGTIEHVHHILNNELAAGVYPSAKYGANAAWLRLQSLPKGAGSQPAAIPEGRGAAPGLCQGPASGGLRFAIFTQFGRVIRHSGHRRVAIPDG